MPTKKRQTKALNAGARAAVETWAAIRAGKKALPAAPKAKAPARKPAKRKAPAPAAKPLNAGARAAVETWAAIRAGKKPLPAAPKKSAKKPAKKSVKKPAKKSAKKPAKKTGAKRRKLLTEAPATKKAAQELMTEARAPELRKAEKKLKKEASALAIAKRELALKLFEKHRGGGEAAQKAAANISLAKLFQVEDEIKARNARNQKRLDYIVDEKGRARGKDGRFASLPQLSQFLGKDRYERRIAFIKETVQATYKTAQGIDKLLREDFEDTDLEGLEYALAGEEYEDATP